MFNFVTKSQAVSAASAKEVEKDSKTLSDNATIQVLRGLKDPGKINYLLNQNSSRKGKGSGYPSSKKANSVMIWVHEKQSSSSSANTALSTVLTLTPLNTTEAKALASIYDIVRTKAVRFQFHLDTKVGAVPTQPTLDMDGIVVFDYSGTNALSGVVNGMDFRHKVGPFSALPASYASSPAAVTSTGFLKSDLIKLAPTPVVDPGILSDYLGGNWVSSNDTGVQVGFIKPYIEPAGNTIVSTVDYYISYLLEYRNRG